MSSMYRLILRATSAIAMANSTIFLSGCTTMETGSIATASQPGQERDYAAVLLRFDAVSSQMLFDPRIIEQPQWARFRADFGARAQTARTDQEFVAAFDETLANVDLFSHFELRAQSQTVEQMRERADQEALTEAIARFENVDDDIGILRINSFFGEAIMGQISSSIDAVIEADVSALIIDLRGNPGGTFAAWPVLSRLASSEIPVGHLVAAPWYASHQAPPNASDLETAIPLTEPDGAALGAGLMDDGLLLLGVEPEAPVFEGRVFILIDGETASTSEIVAAALQYNGRARVVGTRSAGEVLNADQIMLDDGIFLLLPLADFMLPDGSRLEGAGVQPDYSTRGDALECAIAVIRGATACE